ncbi:hypothetical protein DMA10_06395 [Streptomyces sp. WAC 01420]|nr:hypothetical protein DLM49_11390 [Streptomyces sp. WAC 01438]RSM99842.1 hypothetical protein DMA10_06395 [Streptomyces sp. WAC 01420]
MGIGIWTAAVLAGAGTTLWLRDAAEPPSPIGWEDARPAPAPTPTTGLPSDGETCLFPTGLPDPEGDGLMAVLCRR